MKKTLLAALFFLPLVAFAATEDGNSSKASNQGLVDVAAIIGKVVMNKKGEPVGHVARLLADPDTGRIRYAVIEVDHVWKLVDPQVQIPFQAIEIKKKGATATLVLDTTKDKLEKAPRFKDTDLLRVSLREGAEPYYSYWNVPWEP